MKKSYSTEMAEFVVSLEILSELFLELEHTLIDIDKEKVSQENSENIENSCKNYLELTLQQLIKQKDSQLLDEIALDMMQILLKETEGENLGEYSSKDRKSVV